MGTTPPRFRLPRQALLGLFCLSILVPRVVVSVSSDSKTLLPATRAAEIYPASQPPGMRPVVFAPGVVSTRAHSEFGGNFSPDGLEYYFSRREGGDGTARILVMRFQDGVWTSPETVSFSGEYFDYHPCLSRNGR